MQGLGLGQIEKRYLFIAGLIDRARPCRDGSEPS